MINSRAVILFIIAIVMGGAAAIFANSWIRSQIVTADDMKEDVTPVVVASLEIPFGQKIQKEHISIVKMSNSTIPPNSYNDPLEVEGKIANTKIFKGEIILDRRLVDAGEGSTLAALITPKMRAVTVRVNDVIGVAGFLLPGNKVDVLSMKKVNKKAVTDTILEDVKVLAVDQTASSDKEKPIVVRAVTLELEPKNIEKLLKATTEGSVQLALRNPNDDSVNIVAEKPAKKVVKKSKPVVRPASTTRAITVIRGTQVENSKVKS